MTFTENLSGAKNGSRRSYGMLCNEYADKLYAVAFLVLDSGADAEEAVRKAFEDGFNAIGRINDGNHLCAWLSHELTRHIVAKLKEYRADEKTVSDGGIPEKTVFCRLNDLDRLVCAMSLAFGYGVKEAAVITGLKEETVSRKLGDADKKLGKDKSAVKAYLSGIKAPDALITKPPKVHDVTVEIDSVDDDDMIGEMERIAAIAEAEENGGIIPESPKLIRFQPDISEETAEPEASQKIITAPAQAEKKPEPEIDKEKEPEPIQKPVIRIKEEPAAEEITEPVKENKPQPAPEKKPQPAENKNKPRELDAETFINVVTAQRIKGNEFLKLMGNTKISNSVYREIEQNPDLTKERLVQLLESSPLTSDDYYKILTAIKQRNEMMQKKQEAQRKQQEAGLFSINKQRGEPEVKPQPIISDTQAFTANDIIPKEEPKQKEKAETVLQKSEKPVIEEKKPEPEEKPYVPEINPFTPSAAASVIHEDDGKPFTPDFVPPKTDETEDNDNSYTTDFSPISEEQLKAPVSEPEKPVIKEQPPVNPVITEPQTGKREKYKGREYFIDDDVYYKGVNNGKIIFCAVSAVLLIGLSFGVRYLLTGNPMPSDGGSVPAINHTDGDKLPKEYLSDNDIYTAITLTEASPIHKEASYLRADATPYSEKISSDFIRSGDKIYLYNDNNIVIYNLKSAAPNIYDILPVNSEGFMGFTVYEDSLCLLYSGSRTEEITYTTTKSLEDGTTASEEHTAEITRNTVTAESYDSELNLVYSYSQDGDFTDLRITEGTISLVTSLNTAEDAVEGVGMTYLPSYALGETRQYLSYTDIIVPEDITCNNLTVIGTASAEEARATAVLGGRSSFTEFNGDRLRVIIPDKDKTIAEDFRYIGASLSHEGTSVYEGELYGTQFIKNDGEVITCYNVASGCTVVNKKQGEEYKQLSGIAQGEQLKNAVYTDKYVYIITDKDMLYCVDISGDEPVAAEADPNALYSEKLKGYNNSLLGLTIEADDSGNRTGLRLSVYDYDNGLSENRSVSFTVDENTAEEYIRYLYADAEKNNLRIAADEENGNIAVSTVYFDGISEIERIVIIKDSGSELTVTGDLLLFDIQSDYRALAFMDGVLYVITESSVITVDPETASPIGYYNDMAFEA